MEAKQQKIIEAWATEKDLELQNKEYYPNHEAGVELYEFYDQDDGYFAIQEEYRKFIIKYYFLDYTETMLEVPNNNFREIYAIIQTELDIMLEDMNSTVLSEAFKALKDVAQRIKSNGCYN